VQTIKRKILECILAPRLCVASIQTLVLEPIQTGTVGGGFSICYLTACIAAKRPLLPSSPKYDGQKGCLAHGTDCRNAIFWGWGHFQRSFGLIPIICRRCRLSDHYYAPDTKQKSQT